MLKLEHRIFSAIVTFCYKSTTSIKQVLNQGAESIVSSAISIVTALVIICFTSRLRQRRQQATSAIVRPLNHRRNKILILKSLASIIFITWFSLYYFENYSKRSFLERSNYVNKYYDRHPNKHNLHPSRNIPSRGLRYIQGQWEN